MAKEISFASLCAREPDEKRFNKTHQLPIYAASSFIFEDFAEGEAIFTGQEPGHVYSRFGNPTIDAVAEKIAQMETWGVNLEAKALLTSSGMSAISTLFFGLVQPGDKILTHHGLYGGTTALMDQVFKPLQIEAVPIDLNDLHLINEYLQKDKKIRLVYFETPTNPTLHCVDIAAISQIARDRGVISIVDNTFCTPAIQQPLVLGADFVIHSTTKYLNGHGSAIGGAIVTCHASLLEEKVLPMLKLTGGNSNAFDAWNLHNGLKTLSLRMERQSQNAKEIAKRLENHAKVSLVNHLSLTSHPSHELAKKQMRDFGGIISFELKEGLEAAKRFMGKLEFCTISPTLGDVDTLILYPAGMSHMSVPREIRVANGITDGLVRINVGIENVEDIWRDVEQAIG